MFNYKFTSYSAELARELNKMERKQRMKAARYLTKKVIEVATQRFGADSNITKGITYDHGTYLSRVGFQKPAYHAHLIEFGTDTRFTTKGIGSGSKGTGHIQANPFFVPTLENNTQAVINIMQEVWF